MSTNVIMPKLGESIVEGTVTKWLKNEGETIKELESLLEVNTDKVDTEIPSPASGTLLKILVPEGTTVNAGAVLAVIGVPGETAADATIPVHGKAVVEVTQAIPATAAPAATQPVPAPSGGHDHDLGFISPVVTRLARENNVDLAQVKGTGEGGRITKKDVLAYLEVQESRTVSTGELAPWDIPGEGDLFRPTEVQFAGGMPAVSPTKSAPSQPPHPPAQPAATAGPVPAEPAAVPTPASLPGDVIQPLSVARKTIAGRMVSSKHTAAHVTTVMEANLQKVVAHRQANLSAFEKDGARLTFTAYFVAACVAGLKAFPMVNSSWSEQGLVLHQAINIGLAVSLGDEGLIVPVIKGADGLSLLGIARAVNDLAERARARHLQPDDVRGSTLTITNHGTGRSLFATPIINQPNCAILGVGAIQKRPVVIDDAIAIRPMVYLGLTFDHRILDGFSADAFLGKVVDTLENWI